MEKISNSTFLKLLFGTDKSTEGLVEDEARVLNFLKDLPATGLWDICAQFGDDLKKEISVDKAQGFCSNEEIRDSKHLYEPNKIINLFKSLNDSWGLHQATDQSRLEHSRKTANLRQATDKLKRNLDRTVIVLSASAIVEDRSDEIVIKLEPFAGTFRRRGLPMSKKFAYYDRYYVQSCYGSGFLLDDDVMITAGHVFGLDNIVESGQRTPEKIGATLDNMLIIRNFASEGALGTITIPKNQVYKLDDVTKEDLINGAPSGISYGLRYVNGTEDWAWVRVKPAYGALNPLPVPSLRENLFSLKPRLTFHRQNKAGNKAYCLGHPLGMPVKAAYRGMITSGRVTEELFTCKLITLPGNSGSPVFDADTHELIGILTGNEGYSDELSMTKDETWEPTFCVNNYNGATVSRVAFVLSSLFHSKFYHQQQ